MDYANISLDFLTLMCQKNEIHCRSGGSGGEAVKSVDQRAAVVRVPGAR